MSSGFQPSAPVCPTDHATVLQAVVDKLRTDLNDIIGETTCFVSDVPYPSVEINDELFITVSPSDGQFDPESPIGAASLGIVENATIRVTVWSKILLDQIERSAATYSDSSRGLLLLKKRVLASLAGQQIFSDAPTNERPLLVEWLRPTVAQHPPSMQGRHGDADFSSFSLSFEASFYWDLS